VINKKAILVMADGSVYEGKSYGVNFEAYGEVVFNTSMTGYQEMLTDPSYAGQILVLTYPLIGNYGINANDIESDRIHVRGLITREECLTPFHYLCRETLGNYLSRNNTPLIHSIDTRAITRKIRSSGAMMGIITNRLTPEEAHQKIKNLPRYNETDFVNGVTTKQPYGWPSKSKKRHVIVIDCGLKFNILRFLSNLGCQLTIVPSTTPSADILALKPDGILVSPGPSDPELLDYIVITIKALIGKLPIMGICLGNQLIARAFDGSNFKLKFGHRGGNHPVRDIKTGQVHITAQNHGYAVDPHSLPIELEVSHVNLNDNTVEGLRHRELPIFAIQYHAEASPGPLDNSYLFEEFVNTMDIR
jgi:carbamoyl-phosphate synthase small subunit